MRYDVSILDQVLAATPAGGARIVSQNHDTGSINWANGLSDPGEMIACGYLPEAMRRAGEGDAEYQERLLTTLSPDLIERIKTAALKRAGLDTSNGKVNLMVAGEPPWHGLGVNVASAVTSEEAIKLAGLDWHVSKVNLFYEGPDQKMVHADDVFALRRDDTLTKLGHVGTRYQAIQNADGFKFLDTLLGKFGARYVSAGSVFGGERVWMLVELPQQSFTVGKTDRVDAYAIFTNPHDGSGKASCYPTSVRVVCNNTLRVSQADKGKGIGIRHTGNVQERIADAKVALGRTVEGFAQLHEQADALAAVKIPDAAGYFNGVLDAVLDMTEADALKGSDALAAALKVADADTKERIRKTLQKQIDRREGVLEEILARYEGERCGVNGMRGTAWSALNAVTEYADHSAKVRYVGEPESRKSRKFESTIAGDADELKQVAFTEALAYAKA